MTGSDDVQSRKQRLRRQFRARRRQLEEVRAARASRRVCELLVDGNPTGDAGVICGYMARGREVDVRAFLEAAFERGATVMLPRVTGPGRMEFCAIEGWDELETGSFGIQEPTGEATAIDDVEVFLVPGLAFDHQGTRLGFGMGYYDRALPPTGEAVAVGVGYHWQLVDESLPRHDHDRPMDCVVTPRGWHRVDPPDASSRE